MKKLIIGIVGHGISLPIHKLAMERGIQIIDIKTVPKTGKTNVIDNYTHQLKNYIKDELPLIEDLKPENPNKKPLREGSKFIPLKKRR